MNSLRVFRKAKIAVNVYMPKCYTSIGHSRRYCRYYLNRNYVWKRTFNGNFKPVRYISNYSTMKTKDTDSVNKDKNSDEYMQKILEDEEIQNVLKDFANDFGVDKDSNEILEDIRKNLDEKTKSASNDKLCESNNKSLICSKKDLQKFKEFLEEDFCVIPSYEEQHEYSDDEPTYHIDHEMKPKFVSHNLKRGITGVYDIHELIEVLRSENLLDITAISIPKEYHYVDFLVLATARSERHCVAVAEWVIKLYKQKKGNMDPFIKVEGEKTKNWKAIDMGNIVLHILLEETRALYDIESLWLFDSNYDSGGSILEDPMVKIMEEQMTFFNSLNQSTTTEVPNQAS